MDARERFLLNMNFKKSDRPFRWEAPAFWPSTIKNWKNQGLPEWVTEENIGEYFKMDPIKFIPVKSGWTGTPFYPYFKEKIIAEDKNNIIKLEKDGIIKKQRKTNFDTSMPQFIKFPVKDLDDFNKIKFRLDPTSRERLPKNWKKLIVEYNKRDYPLGMFICGSFGHPRNLLGDVNLMYALYDNLSLIKAIMDNWLELYEGYIDIVCQDVIPDFVMIWEDMAYRNGPLISPEHFKKYMFPYLRKLIEFIRNKGIKVVILDSDGDIKKLIPIFIDAGVNALFPFEVQSGMDIVEIRKQYGEKFAIIGGIDKKLLLDKKAITEEIDRKLPYMLSRGGYIPSLDHSVPVNIPLDVFKYFLKLVRSYE